MSTKEHEEGEEEEEGEEKREKSFWHGDTGSTGVIEGWRGR